MYMHKKYIGIVLIAMMFLLPVAFAADEDTMTVTATTNYYDVTLYEDDGSTPYTTWAVGAVEPSSENIMSNTECIAVKNTGNVACDFQIKLTNPANWTVSNSAVGEDQFVLMGIFCANNTASVVADNFVEANDHINTDYITATATVFAGDTDGASVAPNAIVYLYLDFLAPSSQSAAHGQQTITVTIKATTAA